MLNPFMNDAQGALSFLGQRAAAIEAEVYRTKYEDIQYPDLVDIDTSAGEFAQSVEFYSMDGVGQAKWFNHLAKDVPNADVNMTRHTHAIAMAAIGYRYTTEELGYAQRVGVGLDTERANAARRAYEEFLDDLVKTGDKDKNMGGLMNNAARGCAEPSRCRRRSPVQQADTGSSLGRCQRCAHLRLCGQWPGRDGEHGAAADQGVYLCRHHAHVCGQSNDDPTISARGQRLHGNDRTIADHSRGRRSGKGRLGQSGSHGRLSQGA